MKSRKICIWALGLVLAAMSVHAQTAVSSTALEDLSKLVGTAQNAGSVGSALTLEQAERIALSQNPDIALAARKVAAAEAHVPLAGALDDPQAMYRGWQVPLTRPYDYNSAQNMFMLGQSFPGRGKRTLRAAVAQSDVDVAKDELEQARLRVRVNVRKAFFEMLHAQDETRIHDEHVGIAQQAIAAARIKYSVGKIPQVEILKAQLALTRLAEHMIRFDRDAEVARARLNTLMGRQPEMPVEVRGDYAVDTPLPALEALVSSAIDARPDIAEAVAGETKSRKEQDLIRKNMAPDFSVSAGYMLMPANMSPRNNYMVEGSMTLPWLNRAKHDAEAREAATSVSVNRAEVAAIKAGVLGQIKESLAEARAAQRLAGVYQDTLKPQADQTLHAAVVAYENDQTSFLDLLDSQMAVVDIYLASIDALADFNMKMADLEMAVGAPLPAQEIKK